MTIIYDFFKNLAHIIINCTIKLTQVRCCLALDVAEKKYRRSNKREWHREHFTIVVKLLLKSDVLSLEFWS